MILSKINIKVGIDWRIELKHSIEAVITEKVLTVLSNTTVASYMGILAIIGTKMEVHFSNYDPLGVSL
jgi:hypothetical protein